MDLCCRLLDGTPQCGALVGDSSPIIEIKLGDMGLPRLSDTRGNYWNTARSLAHPLFGEQEGFRTELFPRFRMTHGAFDYKIEE